MKHSTIVSRIHSMGLSPHISALEIDNFVDDCLEFLKHHQDLLAGIDLTDDMFELEEARQKAQWCKICNNG